MLLYQFPSFPVLQPTSIRLYRIKTSIHTHPSHSLTSVLRSQHLYVPFLVPNSHQNGPNLKSLFFKRSTRTRLSFRSSPSTSRRCDLAQQVSRPPCNGNLRRLADFVSQPNFHSRRPSKKLSRLNRRTLDRP